MTRAVDGKVFPGGIGFSEELKITDAGYPALERLQELAALNRARNQDLSQDDAEQLADEITRETIEHMSSEGNISFTQS